MAKAFEFAQAADPSVKLYYNDYNDELPEKRAKTIRLTPRTCSLAAGRWMPLGSRGTGFWIVCPSEHIDAAISEFAALGLKVMITELDIDVVERSAPALMCRRRTSSPVTHSRTGCPPTSQPARQSSTSGYSSYSSSIRKRSREWHSGACTMDAHG